MNNRPANSAFADKLLFFCRGLRAAGLKIGSRQQQDALRAAAAVGLRREDDLRAALAAVLVRDPDERARFERAFTLFFRQGDRLNEFAGDDPAVATARLAMAGDAADGDTGRPSASATERLRQKDFEVMNEEERRQVDRLIRRELQMTPPQPARRLRADARGRRCDRQRTLRRMLANGGEAVSIARRSPDLRPRDLVLLCDVSGSMTVYSRAFLQFAHALAHGTQPLQVFVFGTRLSNVSRQLATRDPDRAMAGVAALVRDFDGGTRIGNCLHDFNRYWARRVLARRATVILFSDGLEREGSQDLDAEMQRLARCSDALLWLNPLTRYRDFVPRAQGMRRILPHVDALLPAHNADSLLALSEVLAGRARRPAA